MTQTFKHRDYTLVQELTENKHYMIFDNDGRLCCHASYTKKIKNEEEAKKIINSYIAICRSGIIDKEEEE